MTINNNWYEDFFTGLNVEMWERAATAEWTEQEATFLTDVLNSCSPPAPGDRWQCIFAWKASCRIFC